MKPAWNALLITLGSVMPLSLVLLPTSPSMATTPTTVPPLEVQNPAPTTATTTTAPNRTVEYGTFDLLKTPETVVIPGIKQVPSPSALPQAPTVVIPGVSPVSSPDTPKNTTAPSTPNSATEAKPAATETPKPTTAQEKEPAPSPEEVARQQKLMEADKLYKEGQVAAAEKLYRQVKAPFSQAAQTSERREPINDLANLPPAGQVYWRISTAGLQQNLETKIFVPLRMLVEKYPEFIPGQVRYAQALKYYNHPAEAIEVLERATTLYPNDPILVRAKIAMLTESKQWLEASLAARQFALLNPNHPASGEFAIAADDYLKRYQSHLRAQLRGNTIGSVITGVLGYAFTGSLFGPISAVQTTTLLLRGESAVGERAANQVKSQVELIEDKEVLDYIREIGKKLTAVAGRNDFQYEFYVVKDDKLNAFALPGGKVFVNAGAILHTDSEAELAGLLAHELSHAVLSHGFQLVTEGNLTANVTQFIPYGGTLANIIVLNYSRDMERQADIVGTRILASSGYAADGMRNLMVTLNEQERDRPVFSWLSSHPVTKQRVSYLETLVERNGYNRYAYEGVARHAEIKARVKKLLAETQDPKDRRRVRNMPSNLSF
jgi:predicted Zn-dependent protease